MLVNFNIVILIKTDNGCNFPIPGTKSYHFIDQAIFLKGGTESRVHSTGFGKIDSRFESKEEHLHCERGRGQARGKCWSVSEVS